MVWAKTLLRYKLGNTIARGVALGVLYVLVALTLASVMAAWIAPSLDFEKVLSRLLLLFLAAGLVPMWKISGMDMAQIGLRPVDRSALWRGGLIGVLSLLPLVLFFVVVGFRVLDGRVDWMSLEFAVFVASALAGAILVGSFEETLFRGFLSNLLEKNVGVYAGIILSSLMYAAVHFLESDFTLTDPDWTSGYQVTWAAFGGLVPVGEIWDSFVALFLLGVLLCVIRREFGLWWCISLHASWVFGIRVLKELTIRDVVNPYAVWVGSYDNFVGLAAVVWLLFIFVCLALVNQVRNDGNRG